MKKSKKLFGIFNIVDIILILLVIVAGVVGWKLFFSSEAKSEASGKTYTYVVEGQEVLKETLNFPVVGGKAYNSSTAAYLGTVTKVEETAYTETIYNKDALAYQKIPVDGYTTILLTIEGNGTETEKDIIVEGTPVKVGMELNVKGKGYAFKGIVIEVRDGE